MPSKKTEQTIVIEWAAVKDNYTRRVTSNTRSGASWDTQPPLNDHCQTWQARPNEQNDWEGGSANDTLGYLKNGYRSKQFEHSADYVAIKDQQTFYWDEEEGELDPALALAGWDTPFLHQTEEIAKPGMRLMIEFAFASGTSAGTIKDYGAWVAGLIGSLEASGYDLVVDLWIVMDDLFKEDPSGTRTNILVRVKSQNEMSDFTEWSALFGPTGWRHLGFTAMAVAGDKVKKTCSMFLGTTIADHHWDIDYKRDEAVCYITCDQRAYDGDNFPIDRLNDKAREAGLIPDTKSAKELHG